MSAWSILEADCVEAMAAMDECSIDAVVCDPPYGLEFMGKDWDAPWKQAGDVLATAAEAGGFQREGGGNPFSAGRVRYGRGNNGESQSFQAWCEGWAREALRVLKPGGHLIAFGGTRTYHRLAGGIEDAGFEIRDQLAWLFGSGFPKSLNLDGDWLGWGTALKPGHEPIVLARKPLVGTVTGNVLEHGTGALHIGACRVPVDDDGYARNCSGDRGHAGTRSIDERGATDLRPGGGSASGAGRWPANVILDPAAAAMLDEHDKGGASRFYYVPKTSSAERNAGLDEFDAGITDDGRNTHPTVKPIELMRWLIRLITPPGGTVLDPFTGSGSTGCAAVLESFDFVGIEREAEYMDIAQARIAWWAEHPDGMTLVRRLEAEQECKARSDAGQLGLFGEAA